MATTNPANPPPSLDLRAKRWTAVAVVCFLGLLAALPFRSAPHSLPPTVASSHRERSLRFRAEAPESAPYLAAVPKSNPPTSRFPISPSEHSSPTTEVESTLRSIPDTKIENAMPASDLEPLKEPEEPDPAWRAKASKSIKTPPQKYVALHGENLMDIAERILGDRRRWKELVDLNPQFRSGFDEVREGEEIVITREQ